MTEDADSCEVRANWTPPLFHHEVTTDNGPSGNEAPREDILPSGSVTENHRQNSRKPCPLTTTRSGRVVKPVQRYGHVH